MKKLFFTLLIAAVSMCAFAQNNVLSETKSFFKQCQYTISVGYGTSTTNDPFSDPKVTLNAGLDIQKDFMSFKESKYNLYWLTGVHFVLKGGKQDSTVDGWLSSGNDFTIPQGSIPIHVGAKLNIKRSYLFFDAGPFVSFCGSAALSEGYGNAGYTIESKPVEFGVGVNLGVCFKKFGLSFGCDKGLSNLAKYIEDGEKGQNLKSYAAYARLQWTFNR